VVALNPHETVEGTVCLSLADDPVLDDERYSVHDLLADRYYIWQGGWNYVKLDPTHPAHIFRVDRSSRA
jgi:starch synthase (maltosyl-transferring)